jgi:uncharacterized protein (TIGR04168 family)
MSLPVPRLAIVGDVHLHWDDRDVRAIDAAGYDLVLFVGDLAGYRPGAVLPVARSIARLRTPALVLPGNHDAVTLPHLAAEVLPVPDRVRDALGGGMRRRVRALVDALAPVPLAGYSLHRFAGAGLTVLAARPHSIGGPRLGFRRYLTERFGVRTLEDSAARISALLDEVPAGEPVVVLAHSGPTGLGARRDDIFGRDFHPDEGDFGDPDLAVALRHARATGKGVRAVLAGHMHHHLRGGGHRRWHLVKDGVAFVNAARVPRQRRRDGGVEAHHVRVTLGPDAVTVEEVWLPLDGAPGHRPPQARALHSAGG